MSSPEMPNLEIPDEVLAAVPEYGGDQQAVVIVDFQGLVLGLNKAAEELFKMESADIAGEFVEMLVPSKKRWGHQAYRRGYLVEPRDREMDPGSVPRGRDGRGRDRPGVRTAAAGHREREALRRRPPGPRRLPPSRRLIGPRIDPRTRPARPSVEAPARPRDVAPGGPTRRESRYPPSCCYMQRFGMRPHRARPGRERDQERS